MRSARLKAVALPLLASLAAGSCDLFTGPDDGEFLGIHADRIQNVSGRPFGLGMASSGSALALQLDRVTATQFAAYGGFAGNKVQLAYNPIDVAFTKDGARAYVTILDGSAVFVVNMRTGRVVESVVFGANHHRILLSPDDTKYWVYSMGGKIWAVDRVTGVPLDSTNLGGRVIRGVSLRAASNSMVVSADGDVFRLNSATLDTLASIHLGATAQEVVHSRDGSRVFVALEGAGRIMVLDANTLAKQDSIMFAGAPFAPFEPFAMSLSPDGRTLLASAAYPFGGVAVIDATTLERKHFLDTGGVARRIEFAPDGKRAFVANEGGWIDVIK